MPWEGYGASGLELGQAPIETVGAVTSHVRSRSDPIGPSEKTVEMPQTPKRRPVSPVEEQTTARRLSMLGDREKVSSPTAVPIHFRRPKQSPSKESPGTPQGSTFEPFGSPASPTTPRSSHKRPKSTEFRTAREIRPLWLVERHGTAKSDFGADEPLPSLPSSKTSSRTSSVENLQKDPEEQHDSPYISQTVALTEQHNQPAPLQIDTDQAQHETDILDSRQVTPMATFFKHTEKKEKPKYEFHSPSELLLDPTADTNTSRFLQGGELSSSLEGPVTEAQPAAAAGPEELPEVKSKPSFPDLQSLPPLPDSRPSTPQNKSPELVVAPTYSEEAPKELEYEPHDVAEIHGEADQSIEEREPSFDKQVLDGTLGLDQTVPLSDSENEKTADELFHDAISTASAENHDREQSPVGHESPPSETTEVAGLIEHENEFGTPTLKPKASHEEIPEHDLSQGTQFKAPILEEEPQNEGVEDSFHDAVEASSPTSVKLAGSETKAPEIDTTEEPTDESTAEQPTVFETEYFPTQTQESSEPKADELPLETIQVKGTGISETLDETQEQPAMGDSPGSGTIDSIYTHTQPTGVAEKQPTTEEASSAESLERLADTSHDLDEQDPAANPSSNEKEISTKDEEITAPLASETPKEGEDHDPVASKTSKKNKKRNKKGQQKDNKDLPATLEVERQPEPELESSASQIPPETPDEGQPVPVTETHQLEKPDHPGDSLPDTPAKKSKKKNKKDKKNEESTDPAVSSIVETKAEVPENMAATADENAQMLEEPKADVPVPFEPTLESKQQEAGVKDEPEQITSTTSKKAKKRNKKKAKEALEHFEDTAVTVAIPEKNEKQPEVSKTDFLPENKENPQADSLEEPEPSTEAPQETGKPEIQVEAQPEAQATPEPAAEQEPEALQPTTSKKSKKNKKNKKKMAAEATEETTGATETQARASETAEKGLPANTDPNASENIEPEAAKNQEIASQVEVAPQASDINEEPSTSVAPTPIELSTLQGHDTIRPASEKISSAANGMNEPDPVESAILATEEAPSEVAGKDISDNIDHRDSPSDQPSHSGDEKPQADLQTIAEKPPVMEAEVVLENTDPGIPQFDDIQPSPANEMLPVDDTEIPTQQSESDNNVVTKETQIDDMPPASSKKNKKNKKNKKRQAKEDTTEPVSADAEEKSTSVEIPTSVHIAENDKQEPMRIDQPPIGIEDLQLSSQKDAGDPVSLNVEEKMGVATAYDAEKDGGEISHQQSVPGELQAKKVEETHPDTQRSIDPGLSPEPFQIQPGQDHTTTVTPEGKEETAEQQKPLPYELPAQTQEQQGPEAPTSKKSKKNKKNKKKEAQKETLDFPSVQEQVPADEPKPESEEINLPEAASADVAETEPKEIDEIGKIEQATEPVLLTTENASSEPQQPESEMLETVTTKKSRKNKKGKKKGKEEVTTPDLGDQQTAVTVKEDGKLEKEQQTTGERSLEPETKMEEGLKEIDVHVLTSPDNLYHVPPENQQGTSDSLGASPMESREDGKKNETQEVFPEPLKQEETNVESMEAVNLQDSTEAADTGEAPEGVDAVKTADENQQNDSDDVAKKLVEAEATEFAPENGNAPDALDLPVFDKSSDEQKASTSKDSNETVALEGDSSGPAAMPAHQAEGDDGQPSTSKKSKKNKKNKKGSKRVDQVQPPETEAPSQVMISGPIDDETVEGLEPTGELQKSSDKPIEAVSIPQTDTHVIRSEDGSLQQENNDPVTPSHNMISESFDSEAVREPESKSEQPKVIENPDDPISISQTSTQVIQSEDGVEPQISRKKSKKARGKKKQDSAEILDEDETSKIGRAESEPASVLNPPELKQEKDTLASASVANDSETVHPAEQSPGESQEPQIHAEVTDQNMIEEQERKHSSESNKVTEDSPEPLATTEKPFNDNENSWEQRPKKGKKGKKGKKATENVADFENLISQEAENPRATEGDITAGNVEIPSTSNAGQDVTAVQDAGTGVVHTSGGVENPQPEMPKTDSTTNDDSPQTLGENETHVDTSVKKSKKQNKKDKRKQKLLAESSAEPEDLGDTATDEPAARGPIDVPPLASGSEEREVNTAPGDTAFNETEVAKQTVPFDPGAEVCEVVGKPTSPSIEYDSPVQNIISEPSHDAKTDQALEPASHCPHIADDQIEQPPACGDSSAETPIVEKEKPALLEDEVTKPSDALELMEGFVENATQSAETPSETVPENEDGLKSSSKAKRKAKKNKRKQQSVDLTGDVSAANNMIEQVSTQQIQDSEGLPVLDSATPNSELENRRTQEPELGPEVTAIDKHEKPVEESRETLIQDTSTPSQIPNDDGNEFQPSKDKRKKKNKKKLNAFDWTDDVAASQVEFKPAQSLPEEIEQDHSSKPTDVDTNPDPESNQTIAAVLEIKETGLENSPISNERDTTTCASDAAAVPPTLDTDAHTVTETSSTRNEIETTQKKSVSDQEIGTETASAFNAHQFSNERSLQKAPVPDETVCPQTSEFPDSHDGETFEPQMKRVDELKTSSEAADLITKEIDPPVEPGDSVTTPFEDCKGKLDDVPLAGVTPPQNSEVEVSPIPETTPVETFGVDSSGDYRYNERIPEQDDALLKTAYTDKKDIPAPGASSCEEPEHTPQNIGSLEMLEMKRFEKFSESKSKEEHSTFEKTFIPQSKSLSPILEEEHVFSDTTNKTEQEKPRADFQEPISQELGEISTGALESEETSVQPDSFRQSAVQESHGKMGEKDGSTPHDLVSSSSVSIPQILEGLSMASQNEVANKSDESKYPSLPDTAFRAPKRGRKAKKAEKAAAKLAEEEHNKLGIEKDENEQQILEKDRNAHGSFGDGQADKIPVSEEAPPSETPKDESNTLVHAEVEPESGSVGKRSSNKKSKKEKRKQGRKGQMSSDFQDGEDKEQGGDGSKGSSHQNLESTGTMDEPTVADGTLEFDSSKALEQPLDIQETDKSVRQSSDEREVEQKRLFEDVKPNKDAGSEEEWPIIDWNTGKDEGSRGSRSPPLDNSATGIPETSSLDIFLPGDDAQVQDNSPTEEEKYLKDNTTDTIADFDDDAKSGDETAGNKSYIHNDLPVMEIPPNLEHDKHVLETSEKGSFGFDEDKNAPSEVDPFIQTTGTSEEPESVVSKQPLEPESMPRAQDAEPADGSRKDGKRKGKKTRKNKASKNIFSSTEDEDLQPSSAPTVAMVTAESGTQNFLVPEGEKHEYLQAPGNGRDAELTSTVKRPKRATQEVHNTHGSIEGLFGSSQSQKGHEVGKSIGKQSMAVEDARFKSLDENVQFTEANKETTPGNLKKSEPDSGSSQVYPGSPKTFEKVLTSTPRGKLFSELSSTNLDPDLLTPVAQKYTTREPEKSPSSWKPQADISGDLPLDKQASESTTERPRSLFGGPYGLAGEENTATIPRPKTPLEPISEHVPTDSPSNSRQRHLNDVGSPDKGVKSARHGTSPRLPIGPQYSLPQPKLRRSPKLPVEKSQIPDSQIFDDDRSFQHPIDPGRRAVSGSKVEKVLKTSSSDLDRPRSASSLRSSTGSPGLRRVDKSRSGDLRAASKRDRGNGKNVVPEDQEVEQISSSSTYDPVTDKGKRPLRGGMADVYVS